MSAPSVLRTCEATVYESAQSIEGTRCDEPGQWWESPTGKSYVLCSHHRSLFEDNPCPWPILQLP